MKDAVNVLLIINTTDETLMFSSDHAENGKNTFKTDKISPCGKVLQDRWVPFGLYLYKKNSIASGIPFGFCGSLFGAAFTLGGRPAFSVGMDCPLTYLGGTNSIRVLAGNNAAGAEKLAEDSGNSEDSTDFGDGRTVHARRANSGGSVNWGLCIVD